MIPDFKEILIYDFLIKKQNYVCKIKEILMSILNTETFLFFVLFLTNLKIEDLTRFTRYYE